MMSASTPMKQACYQRVNKNNKLWDVTTFNIFQRSSLTIKNLTNNNHLVTYLFKITASGAYIINRKAAENLLDKALP